MGKGKDLEEKVERNTKHIWWLTVVMIVLLVAAALGGYLAGASRIANEVVEQKNEVEGKGKETNKETPTENTQTEVKEIDLSKSLNTKNYTYSSLTDKDQDLGITIKINNDKKSVTVSYNTKALNSISSVTHSTSGDNYSNEIKGFNKNIKSTFISGIGQDVTGTVLFFLTEDNTVQYVKLFNRETDSQGNTYYTTYWAHGDNTTPISTNTNDVVKLYGANASAPMSSGFYTTLAAKADGSFYDLNEIVK